MKDAAALVFIIDPARTTAIPLARIMDAYGLTRAEAKVALAAAAGNTIAETARLLTLAKYNQNSFAQGLCQDVNPSSNRTG
jgi:hypothetical protein